MHIITDCHSHVSFLINKFHKSVNNPTSCSLSSIFCHQASPEIGSKMYTEIIATQGLASFLPLFHVLPTPSSASPQRAMKCLSHSRLQYVFIDSRVRTQALCACLCESVCVCVGVSNSHCLKLQGPESDDSPQLLDAATRRADVTCPETKSYCSY